MTERYRFIAILLAAALLLLCACSSSQGKTDRYDGYSIRTEKGRDEPHASEGDAPTREMGAGETSADYVLNKSSMKFHDPSCPGVKDIKEQNRLEYYGTRQSVLDMGYLPCKNCNP